jgi:transcription termination factor Rho
MSGEQQLERSVLENKERDELHAIADAMGLKPAARTKKADLVDTILRATGVDVGDAGANGSGSSAEAEAKPRRTRSSRARPAEPEVTEVTDDAGAAEGGRQVAAAETSRETEATVAPVGGDGSSGPSARPEGTGRDSGPPATTEGPRSSATAATGASPAGRGPGGGEERGRNGDRAERPRGFDAGSEPGNRRGRRRRGRDRERGERDLQGQGQDVQFQGEPVAVHGFLDLRDEGFGFLRTSGFLPSPRDIYVSISQVRRFALRKGDYVEGASRPASSNEKYPALLRIDTVSGLTPDDARQRPRFEDLTPLFPDQRMKLEVPGDAANVTARIVDLVAPIGKGQRGMIVSPPKAGKTTVLKQIAHSMEANNPEVHLMVLLVDERPEEATDWRRSVKGEVIASTFDRPSDEHTMVAELAIERARRLVEVGKDVVIILDGITRLARAYNLAQPATGRIMSGGVDSGALYPPKKFFGSARNIEEGGSLTILATALVETGSRMDEVIFEEFKGTGNMELRLDRRLAERRIYPALDVNASSTRHEELLFDRSQLQQVWKLRRVLNALGSEGNAAAGLELLMDKIKSTKGNDEFLAEIAKTPVPV